LRSWRVVNHSCSPVLTTNARPLLKPNKPGGMVVVNTCRDDLHPTEYRSAHTFGPKPDRHQRA
jgi:hypothetical protein